MHQEGLLPVQYQTLVEFLDEIGAEISPARLKHLGKRMASYCRTHGFYLRDVPHLQWGSVKSYPVEALRIANPITSRFHGRVGTAL
jgi:hypothetical protein